QIVILPAGTIVPLKLSAKGSFILDSAFVELPLELKEPIEVVVENGNITGMYQVGQGKRLSLWSRELFKINDLFINITPEEGLTMDSQIGIADRK
ncbi:MAG: hypothetical protein L3J61_03540, partial [Ghiorsea sp.]|nr:hypothetical protein [Ghiorsea sp.]